MLHICTCFLCVPVVYEFKYMIPQSNMASFFGIHYGIVGKYSDEREQRVFKSHDHFVIMLWSHPCCYLAHIQRIESQLT